MCDYNYVRKPNISRDMLGNKGRLSGFGLGSSGIRGIDGGGCGCGVGVCDVGICVVVSKSLLYLMK